ncbi:methionine ABC transporter ATP-binding protein [Hazenella coriacea]|uniref:D-methionine transport system ATP-binding protein n=1 Tax=Hazenella coriacea TaxID=1179467 RepID=A0A4R3LBF7_9BACL|nr:ATP-binding cassette domain-containing protein [Hazenella coriacea]TCS95634.1 D-methionine transport system ATP-binding protein [Hazenella coriacea]
MIQITNVTKSYFQKKDEQPVQALDGVSLQIDRSDIFGMIGHSGAGKSTLLRLLNGLEYPSSGSVKVADRELSQCSAKELRLARQKIGVIFQHFNLLWSRTVRENIAFPLEIAGKSKDEIRNKVDKLLDRVGLKDRADAYPSQLSGGQKQRVGIARALANEPDVLLCDEATSALDPETTASILRLLKEIHQDTGITLVLITHEMSVVRAICNKMAVMENGKIVEHGEVEQIFQNPKHPVTQQFIKDLSITEAHEEAETNRDVIFVNLSQLARLKQIATEYPVSFHIESGSITSQLELNQVGIRIESTQEVEVMIREELLQGVKRKC